MEVLPIQTRRVSMIPPHETHEQLDELLAASNRPVYAVDDQRRIVYCNQALADWLGSTPEQILGRYVEYHSEPTGDEGHPAGFLPGLCPPPAALEGHDTMGTVSSMDRAGALLNRRARFFALPLPSGRPDQKAAGVLALLADRDLSAAELASSVSEDPSAEELHRTIRQFRKGQARHYAVESLLGESSAMRRVRTQIAAAATSYANVLVVGPPGSGRSHVARAIHYHANPGQGVLLPVDCHVTLEDPLRQAIESLRRGGDATAGTLLLEELDCLADELQNMLAEILSSQKVSFRVIATSAEEPRDMDAADGISPMLVDAVATMTISIPPLRQRTEDLPLLAQFFLESCNRNNPRQVGSIASEALDLMGLYDWQGELDQLRDVIGEAHRTCSGHEIGIGDLPFVIQQAGQAAAQPRKTVEKVDLDRFLASVERELIQRALRQAGGNKTEAAELLGMTRPRLYRRLQQTGLEEISDEERDHGTA